MTQKPLQKFGGDWSADKLVRVRKYLDEYVKIMSKQSFKFAYIDAFAGTGYQVLKGEESPNQLLFPELADLESQTFLEGSARLALHVRPKFDKYIFVERDAKRFSELEKLKIDFPDVAEDIILKKEDCNSYLQKICRNRNHWLERRAVLFLDPFGMQVGWETITAIAQTKAIDLWILFPLGVAVNRLLRRDGQIEDVWRRRLDEMFGTSDWFDAFYESKSVNTLFDGLETRIEKKANFADIAEYFKRRLRTVFVDVADNTLFLYNSKNIPLYMLCFAVGNPKGSKPAIRIANHILKG